MKVGQVYQAILTGNKAHIIAINDLSNTVEIEWFYLDGKMCKKERNLYDITQTIHFIKNGVVRIYDDLSTKNPNSLFKENKL